MTHSRLDDLKDLRNSILDVTFAAIFGTLVGGTMLIGFIKHIAETQRQADLWIGLVIGMPSILGLLGIPGAIWGRRYPFYRGFVKWGGWAWRLLHIPLIALALAAGLNSDFRLVLTLTCVLVAAACVQIVSPIYNEWITELTPANSRGWFIGRRHAVSTGAAAFAGLIGGKVVDEFSKAGHGDVGYAVVFGLGCICAIVSMVFFMRMGERVREHPVQSNLKEGIIAVGDPFKDKQFRKVLLFLGVLVLGQAFPGGLFTAFCLETLKLPLASIQAMGLFQGASVLIFAKFWGFLANRYGNKPILTILGVGLAMTPIMWLIVGPNNPYNLPILYAGHIFSGLIWSGVTVCQYNLLVATANPQDRANFMAAGTAIQAVVGGIAPMVGMKFFHELAHIMPVDMAYRWGFFGGVLLRFSAVFFLSPIRESGSTGVSETLSHLRKLTPAGYVAMRQFSASADVEQRETAMENIASRQFSVASDEIVRTLHDPTPRIRRKAAQALSRIGDARAAEALMHQLDEHPDLVEDETIEALGEIGHPRAVACLEKYLKSPRSQLRRAAAKALGELGVPEAEPALIRAAADESDPDLRRAAIQGLRYHLTEAAHDVLAQAMLSPHPSVRIASAEAIGENHVHSAAPAIRESLTKFDDEAASEAAYALGVVGEVSDIPQVLHVAAKCVSMTTRRRCLLGIASQLAVEQDAYHLLILDGMQRDVLLMEKIKSSARNSSDLQAALELYSMGKEPEAVTRLGSCYGDPRLKLLMEPVVSEVFLISALVYHRRHEESHRKNRKDSFN